MDHSVLGGHTPARSKCSRIAVLASSLGVLAFLSASAFNSLRNSTGSLTGNCGCLLRVTVFFFFAMMLIMGISPLNVNHKVLYRQHLHLSRYILDIF